MIPYLHIATASILVVFAFVGAPISAQQAAPGKGPN